MRSRTCMAISIALVVTTAPAAYAQTVWSNFFNDRTERQGASYCSVMNSETGEFFCIEIACDAGRTLTMEFSHEAGRVEDVLSAEFRVNGRTLGAYEFTRVEGSGYSNYVSAEAAEDSELRAMLRNGATAEVSFGDRIVPLSLLGSARAIYAATEACTAA